MGERTQEKAQTDQHSAGKGYPEGAELVLQPPGYDKGQGEDRHCDGEDRRGIGALPMKLFLQRSHEHAPRIQRTQREIHGHPAHDSPPTVQPGAANLDEYRFFAFALLPFPVSLRTKRRIIAAVSSTFKNRFEAWKNLDANHIAHETGCPRFSLAIANSTS